MKSKMFYIKPVTFISSLDLLKIGYLFVNNSDFQINAHKTHTKSGFGGHGRLRNK